MLIHVLVILFLSTFHQDHCKEVPETMKFTFSKATIDDKSLIFEWHKKPHVQQFWDTSKEQLNTVSSYLNKEKGIFDFWIGSIKNEPFCLIMTSDCNKDTPPPYMVDFLSKTGKTYTLDFMIGNEKFLGKGLAAPTLEAFTRFLQKLHPEIRRFIIDPANENTKAIHVYKKTGFIPVSTFTPSKGSFKGIEHVLMIKDVEANEIF